MAGLGNAIGDRAVGEEAGDEDFFAGEKAHFVSFASNMICYLQLLHICQLKPFFAKLPISCY
jgi:hypothetical protein